MSLCNSLCVLCSELIRGQESFPCDCALRILGCGCSLRTCQQVLILGRESASMSTVAWLGPLPLPLTRVTAASLVVPVPLPLPLPLIPSAAIPVPGSWPIPVAFPAIPTVVTIVASAALPMSISVAAAISVFVSSRRGTSRVRPLSSLASCPIAPLGAEKPDGIRFRTSHFPEAVNGARICEAKGGAPTVVLAQLHGDQLERGELLAVQKGAVRASQIDNHNASRAVNNSRVSSATRGDGKDNVGHALLSTKPDACLAVYAETAGAAPILPWCILCLKEDSLTNTRRSCPAASPERGTSAPLPRGAYTAKKNMLTRMAAPTGYRAPAPWKHEGLTRPLPPTKRSRLAP
eukprot:scaffold121_cov412-Prasinococcus_capsulatus_cf.AAC.4